MRVLKLFSLCLVFLLADAAAAQPRRDPWRPSIYGTWYMSGDPYQPCRVERGTGYQPIFVNERGEWAYGIVSGDRIRVPDWDDPAAGGLFGRIRGNMILWSNGTYWTRRPSWG